jgi:hypothetical protein
MSLPEAPQNDRRKQRKRAKQVWPKRFNLKAEVREHVQRVPEGRAFGPGEFKHLGRAPKVVQVLAALANDGLLVRVGQASYVRAGDPAVKAHVPLTVRVRERIEELPPGTTFTRHSELFDDLGSRDAVVQALKSMVQRGELSRVAWGTYTLNDTGGLPTPLPPVRDQVLQRIEALVPDGGEFTLRSLKFTGPSRVPGNVLADLVREGVVTRMNLGVFLRRPGPRGAVARSSSALGSMRTYITQHLSGREFTVRDLPVYRSHALMQSMLHRLKKAGFLVSAGRGRYVLAQESHAAP